MHKRDHGQYPIKQVSIVAQKLETEKDLHGFITTGDIAVTGAGVGAWVGGLFGLLIGGAFLVVPGFGPLVVVGSLAAVLLGTLEGAAVGAMGDGVLSALAGGGVSKQHLSKSEDHVKGGRYLLVAHGSVGDIERAHTILGATSTVELTTHAVALAA